MHDRSNVMDLQYTVITQSYIWKGFYRALCDNVIPYVCCHSVKFSVIPCVCSHSAHFYENKYIKLLKKLS